MYNTHTPPVTIEELLSEVGDKENIIVLNNEQKIYVPVGALDDTLDTTAYKYIMITNELCPGARNITAEKALKLISENYSRTVN